MIPNAITVSAIILYFVLSFVNTMEIVIKRKITKLVREPVNNKAVKHTNPINKCRILCERNKKYAEYRIPIIIRRAVVFAYCSTDCNLLLLSRIENGI
jgi:hypothetical protein